MFLKVKTYLIEHAVNKIMFDKSINIEETVVANEMDNEMNYLHTRMFSVYIQY